MSNSVMSNEIYFIIICFIINICYALLEGKREAWYYHIKAISGLLKEKDEHPLFTAQRTLFYLIILTANFIIFKHDAWLSATLVFAYWLQFTFFHDGIYYVERNKLNPDLYKKKFFDQSTTSKAWTDKYMTAPIRTVMAATGMVLFIFILKVLS